MKKRPITLYIGPSGAEKAVQEGANLFTRGDTRILAIPLLPGPVEFEKHSRSFTWHGTRNGAREIAIVDWLHKHKIGFTYSC